MTTETGKTTFRRTRKMKTITTKARETTAAVGLKIAMMLDLQRL